MIVFKKINIWLYSFLIASFIFFWGINFFGDAKFARDIDPSDSSVILYNFRFNILLLLLPIFYRFFLSIKNNKFIFYINKNFTRIKICILFLSFLLIHYFIISYLYDLGLRLHNVYSIFFSRKIRVEGCSQKESL